MRRKTRANQRRRRPQLALSRDRRHPIRAPPRLRRLPGGAPALRTVWASLALAPIRPFRCPRANLSSYEKAPVAILSAAPALRLRRGAETVTLATVDQRTVTVDAVAIAKAPPDKLEWMLQIRATQPTVKKSRAAVDASLQRLLSALKSVGVPDKAAVISDVEQGRDYESGDRGRTFKGFYALIFVRLTITDFKLIERINSEVLADDLIEVKWLNRVSDHEGELRQKALADAAQVARKKADILASTLGAKVGDVCEITETSFERGGFSTNNAFFVQAQSTSGEDRADGQIQEISVRASINVKFELTK
jgi:uncharacterized protein YggE